MVVKMAGNSINSIIGIDPLKSIEMNYVEICYLHEVTLHVIKQRNQIHIFINIK